VALPNIASISQRGARWHVALPSCVLCFSTVLRSAPALFPLQQLLFEGIVWLYPTRPKCVLQGTLEIVPMLYHQEGKDNCSRTAHTLLAVNLLKRTTARHDQALALSGGFGVSDLKWQRECTYKNISLPLCESTSNKVTGAIKVVPYVSTKIVFHRQTQIFKIAGEVNWQRRPLWATTATR
jgi:hypothetical protein